MNAKQLDYERLPLHLAATGALIHDEAGHMLLVRQRRSGEWTVPGGVLDEGEHPIDGAVRETAEELGQPLLDVRLRVVDWFPPCGRRRRGLLYFLVEGTLADLARLHLAPSELTAAQWVAHRDAITLCDTNMARVLRSAVSPGVTAFPRPKDTA